MDFIAWAPIVGPVLAFGGGVLAIRKTAKTAKLGIEASARAAREQDARSARDEYAPLAFAVRAWLSFTQAHLFGHEFDYFPQSPRGPFGSVSEVLGALRRIADLHPDKKVRESAAALHASIDGAYGDALLREVAPPDMDEFDGWIADTDALIQLIHDAATPSGG